MWDVKDANNVHDQVSIMQMLPKPIASKRYQDDFVLMGPFLWVE